MSNKHIYITLNNLYKYNKIKYIKKIDNIYLNNINTSQ